jgi:cbb3-type cytochrome oxidase maturation protein
MSVIVLLIAAGGVVAGGFLAAFAWAVRTGQFDDTASPALRMLFDDSSEPSNVARLSRALESTRSAHSTDSSASNRSTTEPVHEGVSHVHSRR